MTQQPQFINTEDNTQSNITDLSKLLNQVMNADGWTIDRLSKETGLSQKLLENLCSGKQHDVELGLFLVIARALNCNLQLEKNDLKFNLVNLGNLSTVEKNICPKCYTNGDKVSAERANFSIKREVEEKQSILKVRSMKEVEVRSYYSDIFIPPSSDRYVTEAGKRVYKLKTKLYDSMMFCRDCHILFDNERKRIEKCDPTGFESMLSVNR